MQRNNFGAMAEVAAGTAAGTPEESGARCGTAAEMPWVHEATFSPGMGSAGKQRIFAKRISGGAERAQGRW